MVITTAATRGTGRPPARLFQIAKSRLGLLSKSSVRSSDSIECSSTRTGMMMASTAHHAR